jgi:hypothetical protein
MAATISGATPMKRRAFMKISVVELLAARFSRTLNPTT